MDRKTKIFLVDDHTLFRDGLRRLLASDLRFEVVGEAAGGGEFLGKMAGTKPDVVFMDIDMPGGINGVEATRRALEVCPNLKIIALSMHGEQEYREAMREAGASGFLLKNTDFSELVAAISDENEVPSELLSEREADVLPLICEGLSNHEIAERLFISRRTVEAHRANILAKTGCKNTATLVVYAVKNGLITI